MRRILAAVLTVVLSTVATGGDNEKKPTPADDLKAVQGSWTITDIYWPNEADDRLPNEAGLNEKQIVLVIEGNRITQNGKTVATLTNDLPPVNQHKEVGWPGANRLMLLTLPDGKGLWCSYGFREKKLQITHPHTTSCHRGSGQVVYLERPSK